MDEEDYVHFYCWLPYPPPPPVLPFCFLSLSLSLALSLASFFFYRMSYSELLIRQNSFVRIIGGWARQVHCTRVLLRISRQQQKQN